MKKKIILYIMITMCLVSCNIFEARDSEEPGNIVEWNVFAVSIDHLMDNIVYAYKYKQNVSKYGELFTADFNFIFDNQDVIDYGTQEKINKTNERDMISYLHNQLSSAEIEVVFSKDPGNNDRIWSHRAEIYRIYNINISKTVNGFPNNLSGKMYLSLIKLNDVWLIKRWDDKRKDLQSSTWGRLKNEFLP